MKTLGKVLALASASYALSVAALHIPVIEDFAYRIIYDSKLSEGLEGWW